MNLYPLKHILFDYIDKSEEYDRLISICRISRFGTRIVYWHNILTEYPIQNHRSFNIVAFSDIYEIVTQQKVSGIIGGLKRLRDIINFVVC